MKIFDKIEKMLDEVSPGVLTGLSIVTMLATVGYSIYAGYEIGKIISDEDMPKEEKTKKIVAKAIPVVVGAAFSGTTGYLAHKQHTKAYAAIAGTLAVTQKDNKYLKAFKEKAEEKMGVKTSEEVHQEAEAVVKQQPLMGNMTKWLDNEFGYEFWTTRAEFETAVELYNAEFNDMCEDDQREGLPISRFYELLLRDRYDHKPKHDDYGLKLGGIISFRPIGNNLTGRVLDDGTLGWRFEYEISELNDVPNLEIG